LKPRVGLVWDENLVFGRFLEECGVITVPVTPHLLAAPFFKGQYSVLIVPTGFANPSYSRLLPALRASSGRIRRFVEAGGNLLVYGAADHREHVYDWLPFSISYRYEPVNGMIAIDPSSPWSAIVSDYEPDHIECDGYFPTTDGAVIGTMGGNAVMVEKTVGKGTILVTTIHEYPSRCFIAGFSAAAGETFF
jgi:hypothetical protein